MGMPLVYLPVALWKPTSRVAAPLPYAHRDAAPTPSSAVPGQSRASISKLLIAGVTCVSVNKVPFSEVTGFPWSLPSFSRTTVK